MNRSDCIGCEDDFYNGKNPMGVEECWLLKKAVVVTRFRIFTWTTPTTPGAFTKVRRPNCYRKKGEHFYSAVPDFVLPADVRTEKIR